MVDFQQLAAVGDAAQIRAALPYLEAVAQAQEARIDTRVEQLLTEGALDPQLAVQMWVEKLAYRRILRSLRQKAAFGEAIGAEIAPEMVIAGPEGLLPGPEMGYTLHNTAIMENLQCPMT